MPIYNNEGLDDQPVFDACPSFEGGMVSALRSNLLALNQTANLQNMDISKFGTLTTRRGTNKLGAGSIVTSQRLQALTWFNTPTISYLMAICNGSLYKWDGAAWTLVTGYTAANGTIPCEIVQGINKIYITDGTGHIFSWDGSTTPVDLGSGGLTQPPVAKYLTWQTSRLFAYGIAPVPDQISVSNILDGATWSTTTQTFRVGGGESDPITSCVPWIDFLLVVFKNDSTWVVDADPSVTIDSWTISLIHGQVGCIARRTACQVGADVWFLSRDGVRSVRRVQTQNLNEVSTALSSPIQDIIDRINWATAANSCATFWNNRYILSVPIDSATDPNYTLVYNTITQSWAGYWTGWTPTIYEKTAFSQNLRLVFGQTDGRVLQWRDFITEANEGSADFQDDGVSIPSSLTTRSLQFNDSYCAKKGLNFEMEFYKSQANASVFIVTDQGGSQLAWSGVTTGSAVSLPVNLPFTLIPILTYKKALDLLNYDAFREVQFQISAVSDKISLRSIIASGFIDTLQLES